MTPNANQRPALQKAQQLGFNQLEFIGFEMEAKKKQATVCLEQYAELKHRREEMARLLRMMGAEVPAIEEAVG